MNDVYDVEPLQPAHDRTAFFSGVASLDHYLTAIAGQDQRRHAAAVFVMVERATRALVGYYTLAATSVELAALPEDVRRRVPRYPAVLATLIGRLAVHRPYQGRGIGGLLLVSALDRSLRLCTEVASALVVVDALDAAAADFYRHFGFLSLPDEPRRLFMLMTTVAKAQAARKAAAAGGIGDRHLICVIRAYLYHLCFSPARAPAAPARGAPVGRRGRTRPRSAPPGRRSPP